MWCSLRAAPFFVEMEYKYQIEKNGAVLQHCYGNEERVKIPERLDGCPVVRLDEYAFSESRLKKGERRPICGMQVKELYLPPTIQSIGKYCFYGCRNLEKLMMTHRPLDIGGGAFTGCVRVKKLHFFMEDASGYAFKDVAAELRQELRITLEYADREKARILFSEYYEEAVENTPARILETKFHGSGYHYRQCFQDGVFQYAEFDRLFFEAQYLESEDFCIELALLRLQYPYQLSDEAQGCYQAFLMEHRMSAAAWCIEFEQNDELEYMSTFIDWNAEELSELIRQANGQGRVEIQSFLMDYKFRHQKRTRKTFDW